MKRIFRDKKHAPSHIPSPSLNESYVVKLTPVTLVAEACIGYLWQEVSNPPKEIIKQMDRVLLFFAAPIRWRVRPFLIMPSCWPYSYSWVVRLQLSTCLTPATLSFCSKSAALYKILSNQGLARHSHKIPYRRKQIENSAKIIEKHCLTQQPELIDLPWSQMWSQRKIAQLLRNWAHSLRIANRTALTPAMRVRSATGTCTLRLVSLTVE